jgi:hypothetical protein
MDVIEHMRAFEKGWRLALGHVRREGLAHFDHAETTLATALRREHEDAEQRRVHHD